MHRAPSGYARNIVVDNLTTKTLYPILRDNIHPYAKLMTDEASQYQILGKMFSSHSWTNHPAQSARFLEMAKKLEVDESGKSFEEALGAIAPKAVRGRSSR